MSKKRKSKNEFRYNNKTKHPNFIFEESDNKYRALGITHKSSTFGKPNMPLNKNPKKNNTSEAYIRNGVISETKQNFSKKLLKTMSFDKSDIPNVKSKIRNDKNNRRKKGNKKSK